MGTARKIGEVGTRGKEREEQGKGWQGLGEEERGREVEATKEIHSSVIGSAHLEFCFFFLQAYPTDPHTHSQEFIHMQAPKVCSLGFTHKVVLGKAGGQLN